MKIKNTIPEQEPSREANAGARAVMGKSNEPDAVLRTGLQPNPETTRLAEEVPGKALECIQQQVGINGNPKKNGRTTVLESGQRQQQT